MELGVNLLGNFLLRRHFSSHYGNTPISIKVASVKNGPRFIACGVLWEQV